MLTRECVNGLPGASQGLQFITKNLHRQHSDSELSCRTEAWSVACETHRCEWLPFRWKMAEWCWHNAHPSHIIRVMRIHYEDREVRTASAGDVHACSAADIWMSLKIDQVTVKFATAPTAKVNAQSVSATAGSSAEAEEQRVQQINEEASNEIFFKQKVCFHTSMSFCPCYMSYASS